MEIKCVDILVATYNGEKYISEQINSLLCQTYNNIRIIISDDKSKDGTVDILKEYQKKDSRVELFVQPKNLGYNNNFEFLLTKSKSEYIAFCDQDDIWYEDKVERLFKKLIESDVDLVYCDAKQVNEIGEVIKESYFKYKNLPFVRGKNKKEALVRHIALGCAQLFTKEVKEKIIPFNNNVVAHDWLTEYVASTLKGIDYIDMPLFDYRRHTSNVFGGRDFKSNINKAKNEYGKDYNGFLKYKEYVVHKYLDGINMCLKFVDYHNENDVKEILGYFNKLLSTKYINIHLYKYFKYMYCKKLWKRNLKELLIFHFPIVSYLIYR